MNQLFQTDNYYINIPPFYSAVHEITGSIFGGTFACLKLIEVQSVHEIAGPIFGGNICLE
jgi:hypothetical protein